MLGVSRGFAFEYDPNQPFGSRIDPAKIALNGILIDPATNYRVTVNNFLADGGDGFAAFALGTIRTGGGDDLAAFERYFALNSPVSSPGTSRITEVPLVPA